MIWVVDGYEIDVLVRAEGVVEIRQWDERKKILAIPAGMRRAEVICTIRNILQTKLPNEDTDRMVARLDVFDKSWPINPSVNNKIPYIKEGILHCYIKRNPISPSETKRIKEELLHQVIYVSVSKWEERLHLLIPAITLRKNKKKPYIVLREKASICFDKGLYNLSLETIAYCVFKAITDYGHIEASRRKKLVEKYFPTWKTLEKIIIYAYTTYDHD